ncbi:putative 3-phenylpropionic acid transporter [compost metagenome]
MAHLRKNAENPSNTLLPLGLLNFFIYGTMVIFAAFFQLYLLDVGMDKFEIGSLMAIAPLVSLLAHPFWRHLSDRTHNVRFILLIMLTGLLVAGHMVFKVNTYTALYVTMVLLYFFQSPLLSQSNSLILGYIEGTGLKFSTYRIWGSLGWAFIALASGLVIDQAGHNGISLLFSLTLMLAIGATLVLPSIRKTTDTPWMKSSELARVLHSKYFIAFIVFGLMVSIPNAINSIFFPLFMNDLGSSRLQVGGAVFLSTIFEAGAFTLLHRFLKRKMTYLLACITIVSFLFALRWQLMSEASTPLQIIMIQVLHSVTFGGFFYVGTRLTALLLPRPFRSSGQAVYTFALSGLAFLLAGFLGGWLFQSFGAVIMYRFGVTLTLFGAAGFAAMWYRIYKVGYSPLPRSEEP